MAAVIRVVRHVRTSAFLLALCLVACATVGRQFRSDATTLSQLQVGFTTPDQAIGLLGSQPRTRQHLADGSIALHWQRVSVAPFAGVTDSRVLVLQFVSTDGGASWQFARVLHAQNIVLPKGLPFGVAVNGGPHSDPIQQAPVVGRVLGIFCERPIPGGDMLPIVTRLVHGGRAEHAGWKVGDTIVSVDGVEVSTLSEVVIETQRSGPMKEYVLRRNEQRIESVIDFAEAEK